MAAQFLFTSFAMLMFGFCAYFAWRAGQSAERAEHSEHRLAIMRGQVKGLEVGMAALDEQHKRLAGRVYADEYWRGKRKEQPDLLATPLPDEGRFLHTGPVCENWKIAQRDGPTSPGARCECEYCNARRADRAARRATLRSSK